MRNKENKNRLMAAAVNLMKCFGYIRKAVNTEVEKVTALYEHPPVILVPLNLFLASTEAALRKRSGS